ncbi:MAG: Fe-S cluster assembly protein SufD [Leptolyngbya sp. SIO4C1]|nr:Fe-S cluster assembly protein SufD [Leptolyngbya sp. SIO4C1]
MSTATQQRDTYLLDLLAQAEQAAKASPLQLAELRAAARAMVHERSFPSNRDEDWRFTDLSAMLSTAYAAAQAAPSTEALRSHLAPLCLPDALTLVFVNGHYAPALSTVDSLPGITVAPLSQCDRDSRSYLGRVSGSSEVFTALNTAGFADAAVIWVEKNQAVEPPIQIIYLTTEAAALVQPRCLVVAEPNSAVTLVEQFSGLGSNFINSVTELWLQDGAQVSHMRIQQDSEATYHVGKTAVAQARDSRYVSTAVSLGGKLARHHLEVYQTGPQTDTQLNGLSAIRGSQLADTHSLIALSYPHGSANQLQKNIVDERAHAVFNGRVYVPHEAQLTNAAQLNRNLLLSEKARVDTKPELDIVADNVKCAHGATVSQLQADELFYLQSRGIDAGQAQRLLLYAFAMEILEKIEIPALQDRLAQHLTEWTT